MAEPVIVPVRLEVTDVDTSGINFADASKEISKSMSAVKKSIQDAFSGIDASAINKPIEAAMNSVKKSVQAAEDAQLRYNEALLRAGKSTQEYKAARSVADAQLRAHAETHKQLAQSVEAAIEEQEKYYALAKQNPNDFGAQASWERWSKIARQRYNLYKESKAQLEQLQKASDSINPLDFVDKAEPIQLEKVATAYKKILSANEGVTKASEKFNQTVKDNSVTDEYSEMVKEAESYKKKLAELNEKSKYMEKYGATDSQWEKARNDADWYSAKMDEIIKKMRESIKTGKAFRFGEGNKGELSRQINSFAMSSGNTAGAIKGRAMKNESPYTEDYQKSLDELDKLEKKIESIREKSAKMIELGASQKQFQSMVYDAEQLDVKVDEVKNHLMNMVNEGGAFKFNTGDADAEISKIRDKSAGLQSTLTGVANNAKKAQGGLTALGTTHPKLAAILGVAGKIAVGFGKVMKVAGKVGSAIVKGFTGTIKVLGKVATAAGRIVTAFGRVAKSIAGGIKNILTFGKSGNKSSSSMNKGFKKLTKNVLMFGLGFRTAYYAIKRLRNIFIESFKAMGEQFDEVGNPLKEMMSSFERLKASLATALQPLVSVVMPILTRFMNYLSSMLEAFGEFTATLTGQGHIYKAVAKDINSVSKSAKEANKQLGSYDKLEVIQDNNTGYEYEKQDIGATESAASNFANMVKEAWENADFTGVGQFVTEKLIGVLDEVEKTLVPKITSFVNKVLTSFNTFLDGFDATAIGDKAGSIVNAIVKGLDWTQLGAAFANINNTVWGFLNGLVNSIDWANLGQSLAEGITSFFETIDFTQWTGMVSGLINGITTVLITVLTNVDWISVAETLGTAVSDLFTKIDPEQLGTAINLLFESALTFVETFFSTDAVNSITTFFVTLVETIDWAGIATSLLDALVIMLQSVGDALATSDNPLMSGFGEVIKSVGDALAILGPVIGDIVQALMPIISQILPVIAKLLPPITELISQVVELVLPVIVSILDAVMPILTELIDAILPVLFDILTSLQPIFDALTDTILPVIVHLLDAVMPLIKSVLNLVTALLAPILSLIGPLLEIVFNIVEPVITILEPIIDILVVLCDVLSAVLRPILDALTPILDAVNSLFELLGPIIELVMDPLMKVADIFKFVGSVLSGILVPIINIVMKVVESLMNVVTMLGNTFKVVFSTMAKVTKDGRDAIKAPLNAIIGFLETVANGVVKAVNGIIKTLNKLSFDVPDWVPGLGGKKFGFNLKEVKELNIPRLAQGAVIPPNKEFLAMLGDQKHGTNIEAPLETIKQALAEVMAEFGGAGSKEPIILQVNGRALAKVVWDEQEKRYKQTGHAMA